MSILTWQLVSVPAQPAEYWLLTVDGSSWCSAIPQAPYVGTGQYSVDLTQVDPPIPAGQHTVSVALVGGGVGPQSDAVTVNIPVPTASATSPHPASAPVSIQTPPTIVWPMAVNVTST